MRPHEQPGGLERRLALLTELAQTLERERESLARCDARAISAEASIPERLCRQWMELEPVSEASRGEEVLREQMAQMEARRQVLRSTKRSRPIERQKAERRTGVWMW
jgi:hypothetical protein